MDASQSIVILWDLMKVHYAGRDQTWDQRELWQARKWTGKSTLGNTQIIFSEGRDAIFLNQELMFLIENLHN